MCSIVGYYRLKKDSTVSKDFIKKSFDFMRKRGPDHEDFFSIDDYCTLGHQRLSIIDINDEANQPMSSDMSSIVFNGEIYNYKELKRNLKDDGIQFNTSSDTEVLLQGLKYRGLSFLNSVNGMFSFAYYDKLKKKLILVRDRFGVKPLHYMIQDNILYFSSEIKPLIYLKENLGINNDLYQNFFTHMATDYNEETFIDGIFQVKKGHYLEIKEGEVEEIMWYHGNDFQFNESIFKSKEETLQFVEDILVDAIAIRMRADVPICLTLSGGIDSTTLYTLIKERLGREIKLFTFIHPDSPTNEYEKVTKICHSYNDIFCTVQSSDTNNFDDVNKDLDIVEFPIWGISTRAYVDMYHSIRDGGFKVVIEGHGSDEQLGGYPYIIDSAIYNYIKRGEFFKAYEILKLSQATGHKGLDNKHNRLPKIFIKSIIKFLIKHKNVKFFQETIDWTVEFKILPIVLRAFDRLSMHASLESRAPFMDYRVVELFKKLPIEYKVNTIGNKAILREILKKYHKTYIYEDKEKMGFASDIPKFFNNAENKKIAKKYIEDFDMIDFDTQKKDALKSISKEVVSWTNVFEMSKVILISMINKKYGLTNE